MHATFSARPITLAAPWPRRWLRTAGDLWQRALRQLAERRARQAAQPAEWTLEDVASLDDTTLRDIGVPEWLRDEAAVRREARDALIGVQAASGGLFTGRW